MLNTIPELAFSVSACTRKAREAEVHGRDYYFLSVDEFVKAIENDEFVEWEMVYEGKYYGTLRQEVTRIWNLGKQVIFDVDVEGGLKLKEKFGDQALAIFVMPPSVKVLEERLRARGSESEEAIRTRVEKAESELEYAADFDLIICNDQLEKAVNEAETAIREFLNLQDFEK